MVALYGTASHMCCVYHVYHAHKVSQRNQFVGYCPLLRDYDRNTLVLNFCVWEPFPYYHFQLAFMCSVNYTCCNFYNYFQTSDDIPDITGPSWLLILCYLVIYTIITHFVGTSQGPWRRCSCRCKALQTGFVFSCWSTSYFCSLQIFQKEAFMF